MRGRKIIIAQFHEDVGLAHPAVAQDQKLSHVVVVLLVSRLHQDYNKNIIKQGWVIIDFIYSLNIIFL